MRIDDGARERMRERREAYERGELVESEQVSGPTPRGCVKTRVPFGSGLETSGDSSRRREEEGASRRGRRKRRTTNRAAIST
jgi:hypothetical protein